MERYKIDRINELAHKAKTTGLTAEEAEERKLLRQEYIEAMKCSLQSTLDSMVIVDANGNKRVLKKDV